MYLSSRSHILSDTLLGVALLRLAGALLPGILRLLMRKGGTLPDMTDDQIWLMQNTSAALVIIGTVRLILYAFRRLDRQLGVVPEEDRREMARLQEDMLGNRRAALSAELIRKLLGFWAVVLVCVQFMYEVFSILYRRFILSLTQALTDPSGGIGMEAYIEIYDHTHSFKYQGMFIALLLGMVVTALLLEDRRMMLISAVIAGVFLFATIGVEMSTISLMGRQIGVVWSSLIYHALETVGLVVVAVYLRVFYRGV